MMGLRRLLLALAGIATMGVCAVGACRGADDRGIAREPEVEAALAGLDSYLSSAASEKQLAGMSAGVVHDQDLIWSKGYGWADLERRTPASTTTLYDIGSVAKLLTATMLMQLRDAGRLDLDDPIEQYVPEFKVKSLFPDARPPTFRQVSAHIAGLPRESAAGELAFPPIDTVLGSLGEAEMVIPAMTEVKYSNLGVMIEGYALARVAGEPYTQYVKDHILRPLGMRSSGWSVPEELADRLAVGYLPQEDGVPRQTAPPVQLGDAGAPAGGLYSSVEDLAKFVSLQFSEGPAGGSQVLGSTTLREMRLPVFVDADWSLGVGTGWFLGRMTGHTVASHGGGGTGYVADVVIVPDLKLGFIVLINQVTNQHQIATHAIETLAPAFEVVVERRAEAARQLPEGAARLTGVYLMPEGFRIEVRIAEGRLLMALLAEGARVDEWELVPAGEDRYRIPLYGETVVFSEDSQTGILGFRGGGYSGVREQGPE